MCDYQRNSISKPLNKHKESKNKLIGILFTCPKCGNIPFLDFKIIENNLLIEINCSCQYKEDLDFFEFCKVQKELSESKINFCGKFKDHSNKLAMGYCEKCNLWLCEQCLFSHNTFAIDHKNINYINSNLGCIEHNFNKYKTFCATCKTHFCSECSVTDHKSHDLVDLENESFNLNFTCINKNINEIKDYLFDTCTNYFEKMLVKLMNRNQIVLLKKQYLDFMTINENILKFVDSLINNYSDVYFNYYQISNISNVCSGLNIKKIIFNEEKVSYFNLIEYFSGTFIYHKGFISSKEIEKANLSDDLNYRITYSQMDRPKKSTDYIVLDENYNDKVDLHFKIIIIGNSFSGKAMLKLQSATIFSKSGKNKINFEYWNYAIRYKDNVIKMQLWDTNGDNYYRTLIKEFYSNTSCAIIIYAINK